MEVVFIQIENIPGRECQQWPVWQVDGKFHTSQEEVNESVAVVEFQKGKSEKVCPQQQQQQGQHKRFVRQKINWHTLTGQG